MNKLFKGGITLLHGKLGRMISGWNEETVEKLTEPPYNSLSPIDDADAVHYIDALNWALERTKSKSIYNIALTGPYGSGKSSILKTFQKQNFNPKNVFLEISLATFKEEGFDEDERIKGQPAPSMSYDDENDDNSKIERNPDDRLVKAPKTNEDILRLIELSILQQIFYHEEDSKIPDSRFKKIKSFKRKNMIWVTVGIIAALLFGFNFFYPERLQELLSIDFLEITSKVLRWTSFVVLLGSLSVVIYRSIRLLYGLQVSKLKFHEAEIEIDKNISKSILNNHLDEILYFFEVTDYSVVLIEDLDRFRQAEIFTKLRELNLLINKSKKIKQDVVFIYAVRDEIFRDKERTKFFDFIVPIIPVINSSNSNETLSQIVDKNKYEISKDLIEDVGLFIDDMRLLYNVTNEYYLYHSLLDKELDQNKLLAIVIYKNIYPEDFVQLADEKGTLFNLLNKRKEYVRLALRAIDAKIVALKEDIRKIENHSIKDKTELRLMYLGAYIDEIAGFDRFVVQGEHKTIQELAKSKDLFDYLTADNISYNQYSVDRWGSISQGVVATIVRFKDVESIVSNDYTYEERLEIIVSNNEGRSETLKGEIQTLEREKGVIRHSKIKTLLSDKKLGNDIDDSTRQGQLFKVMLMAGYIDEDYLDFISLFYEGNITKGDRSFLLNVKGQTTLDYDYKLSKIDNLIGKIRTPDFSESYILNFSLLEHLLETSGYESQLRLVMAQLNDKTEYGTAFIESFLISETNPEIFIRTLVATWPGIWKYIDTVSDYTKDRKLEYLKLILSYCNIVDLKRVAESSNLYLTLSTQSGFLTFLNNDKRTKEVIKALNLKFFDLDFAEGSKELGVFIYDGNYYEIHGKIIEKVIQYIGKFNRSDFETKNYQALKSSDAPKLLKYIQDNIDSYVKNVYLTLPDNNSEPDNLLVELLNNEKITLDKRVKIIDKVTTKVFAVSSITPVAIIKEVLNRNKLVPDWSNVLTVYHENDETLTVELIRFLDDTENAGKLADEEFDPSDFELEDGYSDKFILSIINEPKISDDIYELLLNAFMGVYGMDVVDLVSYEKMNSLIKTGTVGNLPENFSKIKEEYGDLQQPLLENGHENLVNHLDEYELDSDDLVYILKSTVFSSQDKNKVVNGVEDSVVTSSLKALTEICKLIFEDSDFTVSKQILMAAMTAQLPIETRVKLFNMRYPLLVKADVPQIFKTFPYPYSNIGVLHKKPTIPYNTENQFLANNLEKQQWISKKKEENNGVRLINFSK